MKKILSVFAMMAMLFASCTPEDQPGNEGGNENEGGTNNGGENTEVPAAKPELKLTSSNVIEFTAEGGDGTISYVLKNPVEGVSVAATCEADWVTSLTPSDKRTTFVVAPYEATDAPRQTVITITYGELSEEVTVHQDAALVEVNPDQPDVEFTATYLFGDYFGNMYSEAYNYYVILSDNTLQNTDQGLILNNGYYYVLDLYSAVAVGDGEKVLPLGTYTLDPNSTCAENTFSMEYSAFYDASGEDLIPYNITSGTLEVTENHIELVVVIDNLTHKVVYDGPLYLEIPSDGGGQGGSFSNLQGDQKVQFENGLIYAEYWGDYYEIGLNNIMYYCYENAETGEGKYIMFETLTSAETFVGDYKFYTESTPEEEFDNLVMPASMDEDYNLYGSWYLSLSWNDEYQSVVMDGEILAPLVDGTVSIAYDETEYICSVLMNAYDDAGNLVEADMAGMFYMEDMTEEPSYAKKNRSAMKSRALRTFNLMQKKNFVLAR